MNEEELLAKWVEYLMSQCGISERMCPRAGCPVGSSVKCKELLSALKHPATMTKYPNTEKEERWIRVQ